MYRCFAANFQINRVFLLSFYLFLLFNRCIVLWFLVRNIEFILSFYRFIVFSFYSCKENRKLFLSSYCFIVSSFYRCKSSVFFVVDLSFYRCDLSFIVVGVKLETGLTVC